MMSNFIQAGMPGINIFIPSSCDHVLWKKCQRDEVKWGEWCRHCDIALGYCWPPDPKSEGGSAAWGASGSQSQDDVNVWRPGADTANSWGSSYLHFTSEMKKSSLFPQLVHSLMSSQENAWRDILAVTWLLSHSKYFSNEQICPCIFVFNSRFGGWKSKIKVSADSAPGKSLLHGLQTAAFLLYQKTISRWPSCSSASSHGQIPKGEKAMQLSPFNSVHGSLVRI